MNIVLTGHRGYIGSHIDWALSCKYGSDSVKRFYGNRDSFEAWRRALSDFIKQHELVVEDPPNFVIHCGAIAENAAGSDEVFQWNYRATQVLSDIFPASHFIYFSSCTGSEPVNTYYGWSKRSSTDWLLATRKNDLCVFVPFNVFGLEYGRRSKFSIPAKIVRGELAYAFEPWIRDYIFVSDAVGMVMKAVETKAAGLYAMGTGEGTGVQELCDIVGFEAEIVNPTDSRYPGDVPDTPRIADRERLIISPDSFVDVHDWIRGQKGEYEGTIDR